MGRMSVATIDQPEFLNLTPYNPLISKCEIKVLYLGENRNKTYISKEVATQMANTLPGCPIVGAYKQEKSDFTDHGDRITIDEDGIHFNCVTQPYGFVAPDALVWFQNFEETDEFGNTVTRTYLMTTGYLWTGQYEEAQRVVERGNNQSMEIDKETLEGKWAKNINTGVEFFIINDAIFSKLCILGEDVEPCFEGASITAPDISVSFAKTEESFRQTLYSMMQDLKFALEGGQKMTLVDNNVEPVVEETPVVAEPEVPTVEENLTEQDNVEQTSTEEIQDSTESSVSDSYASKKDEEDDKKDADDDSSDCDDKEEDDEEKKNKFAKKDDEEEESKEEAPANEEEPKEDDEEDKKKKYSLLEAEYAELQEKYSLLEEEVNSLRKFKADIEDTQKDELINSFYMLSDEDKKDVIANKSQYSLDEIESKLAVICCRKKVNFDLEDNSKIQDNMEGNPVTTFSLDTEVNSTPAWVSALKNTQKGRNI